MKKFLSATLLSTWSPLLLAHPGHGSLAFGEPWQLLLAAILVAVAGLLGYRSYQARKRDDDRRK